MDKNKILEKIKKCLALSKSSNEHEATMALKQAQALMQKHQISDVEIELSAIQETNVDCTKTLPIWHMALIKICADAFGTEVYLSGRLTTQKKYGSFVQREVRFLGCGIKPELAAYAYQVLLRQLKKERKEFMQHSVDKWLSSKMKTTKADAFCIGWISAVDEKVTAFATPQQEKELMARYIDQKGKMGTATARSSNIRNASKADILLGAEKGKAAQPHHAMAAAEGNKQIGVNNDARI